MVWTQPLSQGQILYHFISLMNEIFCSAWISQLPIISKRDPISVKCHLHNLPCITQCHHHWQKQFKEIEQCIWELHCCVVMSLYVNQPKGSYTHNLQIAQWTDFNRKNPIFSNCHCWWWQQYLLFFHLCKHYLNI